MEYEDEHRKITNGSVRFGAFLKSNSIVQYNDITETYLETLMDVEMRQVREFVIVRILETFIVWTFSKVLYSLSNVG